ncbi:MAG: retroviral-like aspartic protease family protein [Bacteroidaceae bacterium]|nr:retroviral-like aspartic protease family protein [Bacteroidaceae bacterium]
MRYIYVLLIAAALAAVLSCANKPKPIYYDSEATSDDEEVPDTDDNFLDGSTITVPFRESAGVKLITVKVNGMTVDMIFDTGCSETLISIAEANYLYQKGRLTDDDIVGSSKSVIADGSVVEDMVVNLKEVIVGDKIRCQDVKAVVSKNVNAPLLLGNEILDRVLSYTIDNENKTIVFELQ